MTPFDSSFKRRLTALFLCPYTYLPTLATALPNDIHQSSNVKLYALRFYSTGIGSVMRPAASVSLAWLMHRFITHPIALFSFALHTVKSPPAANRHISPYLAAASHPPPPRPLCLSPLGVCLSVCPLPAVSSGTPPLHSTAVSHLPSRAAMHPDRRPGRPGARHSRALMAQPTTHYRHAPR